MSRLIYLALLVLIAGSCVAEDTEPKWPNFILILTDDQGWVQTSTQMDPDDPQTKSDYFRTPHMDSMFEDGMMFVRGYSPGTYCLPTRRAIQSSHSTLRHVFNGRPVDEWTAAYRDLVTIPRILKGVEPNFLFNRLGAFCRIVRNLALTPNSRFGGRPGPALPRL